MQNVGLYSSGSPIYYVTFEFLEQFHNYTGKILSNFVGNLYLGFVPFLRLMDVFGGQALILQTDVPQSSCKVRFSHLHVHLYMLLLLHLDLQFHHFLQ